MVNLTQHRASSEQIEAGVFDLNVEITKLLTFEELPTSKEIAKRAGEIAALIPKGVSEAMIGGAPFLMPSLERALRARGVTPFYAFSKRVVEEKDGTKVSVFKHIGFVEGI